MHHFILEIKPESYILDPDSDDLETYDDYFYYSHGENLCRHEGTHFRVIPIRESGWQTVEINFNTTHIFKLHYPDSTVVYKANTKVNDKYKLRQQLALPKTQLPYMSSYIRGQILPIITLPHEPSWASCHCTFMPSMKDITDYFQCPNYVYLEDELQFYTPSLLFQIYLKFPPQLDLDVVLLETKPLFE